MSIMLVDNNGWWENCICAGTAMVIQAIQLCVLDWYLNICVLFYASKASEDYVDQNTDTKTEKYKNNKYYINTWINSF